MQIMLQCVGCGKMFPAYPSDTDRKWCSRECRYTRSPDNFWTNVDKTVETGCWHWIGRIGPGGYGYTGAGERAHRVSWRIAYGAIQRDTMILHKCDNPQCVNPDHLFLGTHEDNMRDMAQKGRSGVKTGRCSKHVLTAQQVDEIRKIGYSKSRSELSRLFGVSRASIINVLEGHHRFANGPVPVRDGERENRWEIIGRELSSRILAMRHDGMGLAEIGSSVGLTQKQVKGALRRERQRRRAV